MDIVDGYHNDANCEGYQEEHELKHGKAPQPCKFKGRPEEISKLLEKISTEDQNRFVRNKLEFSLAGRIFKKPRRI